MNSTTVSPGDIGRATDYNELRLDVLELGGDYAVTTGSSNAYLLTLDSQITGYSTGLKIVFKANHTSTGASTINVNSIGVKNLRNKNMTPISQEIQSGRVYQAVYDGTDFIVSEKAIFDFGDGSDGDVTISTNTTLTRDMYYNNLTINTGISLNPDGFAIYVRNTLTINGTGKIVRNGNNASGSTGATALNTGTCGPCLGGVNGGTGTGGNGDNGTTGVSVNPSYASTSTTGSTGGNGGNALPSTGGTGGTGGSATRGSLHNVVYSLERILTIFASPSRALQLPTTAYGAMPSGGGGGGGAGLGGGIGGNGGGSGGSGGIIFVYASNIAGTGTIEALGGTGGNGQAGSPGPGSAGGGGGGAGGSGGIVVLVYKTGTPWTITLTGGAGGTGTGGGANGSTGTTGQSILIQP